MLHQAGLQAEAHQRRAKHQCAVHGVAQTGGRVAGVQHGGGDVDQQKTDQKRLGTGVLVGQKFQRTPGASHHKRSHKTQHIEHPPGAAVGNEQNRQVQHGVVTEQGHVAALPGRQQYWHGKATRKGRHRQRTRVLHQGQHAAKATHHRHQHEGRQGGHQAVQAKRGKYGEVQHRHAPALQCQRKTGLGLALAKPYNQQRNASHANSRQPKLHGQQA